MSLATRHNGEESDDKGPIRSDQQGQARDPRSGTNGMLAFQYRSLSGSRSGLQPFQAFEHGSPDVGCLALTLSVEFIDTHGCMQERGGTVLSLDCERATPELLIPRHDGQ